MRKAYPSDITREEFSVIEADLAAAKKETHPREWEAFAQAGIAMGSAIPYLNGVPVNGQTYKALKEFDIGDIVTLMAVVNKDNN